MLNANALGSRCRGRPFRAIKDAFVYNLKEAMPDLDERESTQDCIRHTRVELDNMIIVKINYSRER